MSTMKEDGTKIVLPRTGPEFIWEIIEKHYSGSDPLKWKYLAMLALRESAGWNLEHIGIAFSHDKGHVSRCLKRIKEELRRKFIKGSEQKKPRARDEAGMKKKQKSRQKSNSQKRLDPNHETSHNPDRTPQSGSLQSPSRAEAWKPWLSPSRKVDR
ncbi:MAG: hypothetical protein Tsb009_22300 [Planctomycetaceae bacterium]